MRHRGAGGACGRQPVRERLAGRMPGGCRADAGRADAGRADVVGYAFVSLTGFQTRRLTRKTDRTAEDLYDSYADSPGQQRRFAHKRGGERRNE